ncbi:GNAT family N-acetyltransferase [Planosporangium mesophilum]|uniref:Uncharacterized protein n=1 Tax=Planosporangium mesophilum TaxID=689768 RepID=A0A8J3TDS1_9ACTN|nr:hypothetical protein [Planosporangium mesophilum]GII24444.1 hypothetical protein Pme01_40410 [Planosporangium mesophilum]
MIVRSATLNDVDTLVDIHRQARDTYYRGVIPDEELDDPAERAEMRAAYERAIPKPGRRLLCAEHDGAVVGFAARSTTSGRGPSTPGAAGSPTGTSAPAPVTRGSYGCA